MTINQITSVESFFFVLLNLTPSKPVEPEEIGELKKLIQNYMKEESVSWNLKVLKAELKGLESFHQEFQDVEKIRKTPKGNPICLGGAYFFKCFNGFNFVGWCFLTNFQGAERWFSTRICWFSARIELETKHCDFFLVEVVFLLSKVFAKMRGN